MNDTNVYLTKVQIRVCKDFDCLVLVEKKLKLMYVKYLLDQYMYLGTGIVF